MGKRLLDLIAPLACPACDGSSGLFYSPESGIAVCNVCAGSGRDNQKAHLPVPASHPRAVVRLKG